MKDKLIDIINNSLNTFNLDEEVNIEVSKTKSKENGDYSSNIAMKLTKILKKNPLEIANEIAGIIKDDCIINVEVKAPGFINFFLDKKYLLDTVLEVNNLKEKYGFNTSGNGKKINIEFVSANPTGILHMGNARGGAYGDSLARLLTFSGYDVTKEYYINDAGNQITNLGLSIKARYDELCGITTEMPENGYFGKEIYDIANELYDKDKDSLLNNELDFFKNYGKSYLIDRIVDVLEEYRIHFDVFTSELTIAEKYGLNETIQKLTDNGYTYEKDGALWFKCSELLDDKDHVLIKEDKSFTYLVPDIAYHADKFNRGFEKLIDILGTDHHGYVARIKSSQKALGYNENDLDVKLLQLVRLVENGEVVKMSKRTGKSVTLNELINEVGVNAARYYFSRYSLDTQMDFDLSLAKSKSNENPVFYVNYAYARICSILNEHDKGVEITDFKHINNENAYDLMDKVYQFKDVVLLASKKELPHLITNYVYELASEFHLYYSNNRIITDNIDKNNENILLINCVKQTIKNALNLIGVEPLEKM